MNIAFFDAQPHWSGGAKRVFLISRELSRKGHNVHIICLPKSGLASRARDSNVPVHLITPSFYVNIFTLFRIIAVLKKEKIQIVDINSPKFYWYGLIAGRIVNAKTVITRNVPFRKKGIKKIINRILYSHTDLVVTVSKYVKNILETDYGRNLNIEVIYDGIDMKEFSSTDINSLRNRARNRYRVSGRTVLGIIGRIDENKGHDIAIKSLSSLKQKKYNVCLLIVGTGDKKIEDNLNKLVQQLNLSNEVIFTGFCENIVEIISAIDIIIAPSFQDALPMNITESLSLGKPVIASSVGGIPEIIENNINGILVPPGDIKLLSDAIEQMLISGYERLSNRAYETVKEKFSIETAITKYEKSVLQ